MLCWLSRLKTENNYLKTEIIIRKRVYSRLLNQIFDN